MIPRPHVALDGHYSITEAATLLGKSRRTLYRWWKDYGLLKVKKHRYNNMPFVLGREILRIYDLYE